MSLGDNWHCGFVAEYRVHICFYFNAVFSKKVLYPLHLEMAPLLFEIFDPPLTFDLEIEKGVNTVLQFKQ